jgi:hypothetical protein
MVAMVSIGAMRLAIEDWRPAGGERSLADYLTGYLKQTALASPERKATPGAPGRNPVFIHGLISRIAGTVRSSIATDYLTR